MDTTTNGTTPLLYQWNFGDNTANSTDQSPTHTYTTAGTYVVSLTVTDADGDIATYVASVLVQVPEDPEDQTTKAKESFWTQFIIGITLGGAGVVGVFLFSRKLRKWRTGVLLPKKV
ncbi:MAG: fibronectin type III domain-containing protein [Promethearchaeota archaeon CR_4]|nr:MAG: fibronectin type III domain-containing protein [Candidatus Lokiarchaeota archaeon CR_4]